MPARGLPPSTAEIAARRLRLERLAGNLERAMAEQGLTQSDLARRIWGEYLNPRTGRVSAKNRDRISSIIRRKSWPDRHNLVKIAKALSLTPEELTGSEPDGTQEAPELALVSVAGRPNKVRLRINQIVSRGLAGRIIEMLDQDQNAD